VISLVLDHRGLSGASDVDFLGGGVAPDLPVLVVDEPVVEVAEVG
jgi:hypothetical protein